jgi:hypothetical protein
MGSVLALNDLRDVEGEPRVLDLRLAERLGFERPRAIRQLIERHQAALKRHGSLPHDVANPSPLGGRPAIEYWLNEAQALLICTKSETQHAGEVVDELIRVFLAWHRGEFVSGNMTPATNAILDGVRTIVQPMLDLQQRTHDNVVYIRGRIDDHVPRYDFSKQTHKLWLYTVIRRYDGGFCPCGCNTLIVKDGEPIPGVWQEDHWYSRERNGLTEGWPVSSACNQALRDGAYRESKLPDFQYWLKNMEWATNRAIAPLLVPTATGEIEVPKHVTWKQKDLFEK